jgi:autotransporter-associated beta strand protein
MPTHTLIHRGLLLIVLSAGVGCAGAGFAADGEGGEWSKKTGVEIPRELAMRPLPTYRIEPPDIIQIEINCAKAARGGENQPAKKWEEAKPSGSAATESSNSSLNVTNVVTSAENKSGGGSYVINGENKFTGNVGGTITLSGTRGDFKSGGVPNLTLSSGTQADTYVVADAPAENVADNTTVPTGTLTFNDVEPVAGEPLNKVGGGSLILGTATFSNGEALNKTGTGTITLSGPNTYSGTITVNNNGEALSTTKPGNLTLRGPNIYSGTTTFSSNGTYVFQGDAKPSDNFVASNTPPSTDSITLKRTNRGISGAALGTGQYLVGPDGTINMRQYGTVQVTGMTIAEVKAALEKHLSKFMESPEVWVDVLGHNSKVFYVITDGAGSGDNVRRIPITGNETVLDAIAAIGGLSQFSSKKIWISRPSPTNSKKGTILTVDYAAITQRGATETNYQIMPGDRIFIAPDSAIAINVKLGKVTAPMERVMGVIGLGTSTIRSVKKLMIEDKDHQGPDEDEW